MTASQTDRHCQTWQEKDNRTFLVLICFNQDITNLDNELEISMKWLIVEDAEGRINYTALEMSKA